MNKIDKQTKTHRHRQQGNYQREEGHWGLAKGEGCHI